MIHPTAIIDPSAKIGKQVSVGPYSIIGPDVEIGDDTWIGPHVVVQGPTHIGHHNRIFQFSSIGEISQDLKFDGQKTFLNIGDHNVIREFCTINRGTFENHTTKIGSHNLFMAYVHIAHDCQVGNYTIFANNASLAGHVTVHDYVILSGFSGVFQFCRVGAHSFAATNSVIIKDVPPFIKVSGYHAKPYGLNTIGLQRRGFQRDTISQLRKAYRVLYRKGLTIKNAIRELQQFENKEIAQLIQFIDTSECGIVR